MSTPSLTEKWVPLGPNQRPLLTDPPAPVDGNWLKVENNAMVWKDPITDADTKWHMIGTAGEPPFLNGWQNYGGQFRTVGFRKLSDNTVALTGLMSNTGTWLADSIVFMLPVGYRPSETSLMRAIQHGLPGACLCSAEWCCSCSVCRLLGFSVSTELHFHFIREPSRRFPV